MKRAKNETQAPIERSRSDYLCVLPVLFMSLMTFIMLLMDITTPSMDQGQYTAYPSLFTFFNGCIFASYAVFFGIQVFIRKKASRASQPDSKKPSLSLRISMISFGLFMLLVIASTFVNGFGDKAIHGVSFRNIGIFHIMGFILIYMGMSACIKRDSFRTAMLIMFSVVSDLVATAALTDRFLLPIAAFREKKDLSAIFFNGNHYGYFLVMALLIGLGLFLYSSDIRVRAIGVLGLVLNSIVLALNGSLGCLIGAFFGMLFTLVITFLTRRDVIKLNLAVLGAFAVLFFVLAASTGMMTELFRDASEILSGSDSASSAGHNRWLLWTTTFEYIKKKPLLGYGCEGLSDILMNDLHRGNPHNEVLSYAAQFGVPAALAYVTGCISWIVAAVKDMKSSGGAYAASYGPALIASVGYFASSLFGVTMFYTVPFFFIFMGIGMNINIGHLLHSPDAALDI